MPKEMKVQIKIDVENIKTPRIFKVSLDFADVLALKEYLIMSRLFTTPKAKERVKNIMARVNKQARKLGMDASIADKLTRLEG